MKDQKVQATQQGKRSKRSVIIDSGLARDASDVGPPESAARGLVARLRRADCS